MLRYTWIICHYFASIGQTKFFAHKRVIQSCYKKLLHFFFLIYTSSFIFYDTSKDSKMIKYG